MDFEIFSEKICKKALNLKSISKKAANAHSLLMLSIMVLNSAVVSPFSSVME